MKYSDCQRGNITFDQGSLDAAGTPPRPGTMASRRKGDVDTNPSLLFRDSVEKVFFSLWEALSFI